MKKLSLLAISLLLCIAAHPALSANRLDPAKKAFILSRFCTEVKYNFVHFDKLACDWDSLCMAALPTLTATPDDETFIDELKRLCCSLHDGHTYISIGNGPDKKDWIRPLPLKTKRVGKRLIVTAVYNSDFIKKGLQKGSEILKIDGLDPIEFIKNKPFASSTLQWSEYGACCGFEWTKEKGTTITRIEFLSPNGKKDAIETNRLIKWDLQQEPPLQFSLIENNIGILTIRNFSGNFIQQFDAIYPKILQAKALIIDIRDNSGGNSGYADYLIRHFCNQPIRRGRWSSRSYVATLGSWGYPQQWHMEDQHPLQPVDDKEIYDKPIVMLVNASTFSSAENLCVTFKGARRGKIIGTPTAGSTGNPIFVDLGYDIFAAICTRNEWDADGNEFNGKGIAPDITVEEDPEAFLNGNDNVVDAALEIIHESISQQQ